MKKKIVVFYKFITEGIPYKLIYYISPFKLLAYICGVTYGRDNKHLTLFRIIILIFGIWHNSTTNLQLAIKVLNKRLEKMPIKKRRKYALIVWQTETAMNWAQRAFDNVKIRSKGNQLYKIISDLKKPSILELGCTNGGSLNCILYLGAEVEKYCGIDVAEPLILEGRKRFNQDWIKFYCMDFIDYCLSTTEQFDALLIKQTFIFLDQEYLEKLLEIISRKKIARRIFILERQLITHKKNSIIANWGNIPIDYSHDYEYIFDKYGYEIEEDFQRLHPHAPNTRVFEAILHSKKK